MRATALSLIAALLMSLVVSPSVAEAVDMESVGDTTFDVAVLRPVSGLSLVIGSVLFVPASLLAAPSGRDGIDEVYRLFIRTPYESTVERPLGEF